MMRTISAVLFFMISCICTTAFSSTTHTLATGTALEAELPPNDPQVLVNPLYWKLKGVCEVVSDSLKNPLSFKMLSSKGSIDGVEFLQGDSLYIIADAGQRFTVSADIRAKIEVVNHGATTIKLRCSA